MIIRQREEISRKEQELKKKLIEFEATLRNAGVESQAEIQEPSRELERSKNFIQEKDAEALNVDRRVEDPTAEEEGGE